VNRTTLFRAWLTVSAGWLMVIFAVSLIGAPTAVVAGGDPVSGADSQPQQPTSTGTLCFVDEGAATCVARVGIQSSGVLTDQVRALMQSMLAGPTAAERAAGVRSALPDGATLVDVLASRGRVVVRLNLPADYLATFDAGDAEDANRQVATTLTPYNFARIDVETQVPSVPGLFRPLSSFLPPIQIPTKPGEPADSSSFLPHPSSLTGGQPPEFGQPQTSGGLRNKTVFVSAGHGWYWSSTLGQYRTQRPEYPNDPYPSGEGIVEDFNNAEIVNQYLLQYLWNAGADAWTVRERSLITEMHVVDDVSPAFSVEGVWNTGTPDGYGGSHRYASSVTSSPFVTATWTFTPAASAEFAVYVWYPNVANRTPAARYFVEHAGGTTVVTITQQRDGINWRYIGTYPFRGGVPGRLRLTNQSIIPGATVLADAVRIGGGIGDTIVGGALGVSGKPRWEEQARQYAKWIGLPDADDLNDVIVRPIFSEWESESGEDAIYISYHTNGYNGYNTTARGTETYIHSFEPTPNSDILQDYIHAELLQDTHLGWEPTWPDRGQKSADLGELRLLETMPGVLIENGYHDSPADVEAAKDPRFNLLSARAIYQGIVRYWNSQDANVPLVFLPEPPTHLRVRNSGPGQVTLAWQPGPTDATGLLGHAATAYRVYTSTDGFGWGNAISTTSTSLALSGLAPGQLVFVRVTGVNQGGESFPTPVLAARVAASSVAPMLIVYGFDRIDRRGLIRQFDGAEGYNRRMFLDRINRYDYVIQHATGITLAFDSALRAAVTDGDVGLGNYTIVDWIAGEEQSPDVVLNATDQSLLQAFLDGGGALLIGGAEIGFDLVGNGVGPTFYSNVLRAQFSNDDAGTYAVTGQGLFGDLGAFSFDDGTRGAYDVDWPDAFVPQGGAVEVLRYNGGTGGTAALYYASGACTRLIYMGFPLETIYPQARREQFLARAMSLLSACAPPAGLDTAIASPADGAAYNALPPFNGTAAGTGLTAVQVAILSGTQYHNGSGFVSGETWLTATGTSAWSYSLPVSLPDGDFQVRARAFVSSTAFDTTPAAITFTLDRVAPAMPVLITPTGGISMVALSPLFAWSGGGDPSGFDFELDGVLEVLDSPALSVTHPVTAGPHTWRVRAFDRAGNASGWSTVGTFNTSVLAVYLPLISMNTMVSTPVAPTCTEAIGNGGFESGLAGWTTPSFTPPPAAVNTPPAFEGVLSARVGSPSTAPGSFTQNSYSSVEQTVTIPVTATSAQLSFQRYRISGDTLNDLQYVIVLSGGVVQDYLVRETVNDPAWLAAQFDLLAYAGQSIAIRFSVKNDPGGGSTGMYIDAVSLQVCTP
jgi:N-acetylmuramoyl-L-alanine amidase